MLLMPIVKYVGSADIGTACRDKRELKIQAGRREKGGGRKAVTGYQIAAENRLKFGIGKEGPKELAQPGRSGKGCCGIVAGP